MSLGGRWRGLGALGWLFVALLASGCTSTHLTVHVRSPAGTNQGRPLHMVVRTVDAQKYLTETYADVATKVVAPDDSVLQSTVVYPGTTMWVRVKLPEETSVAVSFLFTTPDGAWQSLLDVPVPTNVEFELLEGRIKTNAYSPALPKPPGEAPKLPEAPKAPKLEAPKAPKFEAPKVPVRADK